MARCEALWTDDEWWDFVLCEAAVVWWCDLWCTGLDVAAAAGAAV